MCGKFSQKQADFSRASGFTLIEVVVAIFIMIVGISGLFGLINETYSYSSTNSLNLQAAYLGKEGMEIVKNIRDSNFLNVHYTGAGSWDDGLTACQLGCQIDYASGASFSPYSGNYLLWDGDYWNYSSGRPGTFQRKITVTSGPDADEMNVKVEVFWSERGRPHSLVVQENLYKWWQ